MQPRRIVDSVFTADGRELILYQRGDLFVLEVDTEELMSSRAHGSEDALAELGIAALGPAAAPRVLVGGLGMGFTLRAVLDALADRPAARVTVAEVFPAVVAWNRAHLGHLARQPLDDPRVELAGDVADSLAASDGAFDLVLLDVDNGPDAFTLDANRHLYSGRGVERLARALAPNGVVAVWSAADDPSYAARMRRGGFEVEVKRVPARASGKGGRHVIFLARRR